MRCPRCQFENMPGQTACFRCGSLLEAKAGTMEVHPPRAPAWKKPFRRVAYGMRHYRALREAEGLARQSADRTASALGRLGLPGPSRSADAPRWGELWLALRDAAVALALSIVPGLAQALRHQFGAISGYVLSWFISLVMGLVFFGQALGGASMACAFVLHAWIAMDAVVATKRFKEKMTALQKIGWRLCGIGFLVILLYAAYIPIERAVGYTVGVADVTVPGQQVQIGDSILCRSLAADLEPPPLKRGDLVLVRVREMLLGEGQGGQRDQRWLAGRELGDMVGQLIALPGDQVALTPKGFIVNDRALDPVKFAVPNSLKGQSARVGLGKDEYFVTMEWQVGGHGIVNAARVEALACVHPRADVLARGVMRWSPIWRRGFLKEFE